MRRTLAGIATVAVAIGGAVAARPAATQAIQQCYYRAKIDPVNSCTICANSCLGGDAKCCIIVSN
ncbi:MAG TPA: hypothetical protein VFJ16_23035 [Longimicrobium sp.]|nr:hypothetical protein [Longimicrobium sp.]